MYRRNERHELNKVLCVGLPTPSARPNVDVVRRSRLTQDGTLRLFFQGGTMALHLLLRPTFSGLQHVTCLRDRLRLFLHSLPKVVHGRVGVMRARFVTMLRYHVASTKRMGRVLLRVLTSGGPQSSARPRSFALTSNVGPVTPVLTRLSAHFRLRGVPFPFTGRATRGVVVVGLSRGTSTLAIAASNTKRSNARNCIAGLVLRRSTR